MSRPSQETIQKLLSNVNIKLGVIQLILLAIDNTERLRYCLMELRIRSQLTIYILMVKRYQLVKQIISYKIFLELFNNSPPSKTTNASIT